jgi:hypothetical protein
MQSRADGMTAVADGIPAAQGLAGPGQGASAGLTRLRPFWSLRPVPMHSRQTTHLPSWSGAVPADHQVHPDPAQTGHRSFSAICLSL